MEGVSSSSLLHFGTVSLSGGELILSVVRAYTESFGKRPDIAMTNLLIFLIEGDGGIESDVMFSDTPYGPKSPYIHDFVTRNTDLIKIRAFGKKPAKNKTDPDMRMKLELTELGKKIANLAISSLSKRDSKIFSKILSGWGNEKHSELLTYICVFFTDFCKSIERKTDD